MSKVEDIIKESGNSFHAKVVNYLRDKDWMVVISPYYKDNATDKSREVDIMAEKAYQAISEHGIDLGYVHVRLFIECKYINKDTVFWFDERDGVKSKEWVIKFTPCENNNIHTDKHHYLINNEVAKLFSSQKDKSTLNEPIYTAINQSLSSMIYLRTIQTMLPKVPGRRMRCLINYPLIICNNFKKFHQVTMQSDKPNTIDKPFQIEVNYAYKDPHKETNENKYFLIDVANFEKIDDYFDLLNEDINIMKPFLN